mmetsp:Transcript_14545/g.20551  ORF Transcript_14545/g.20551 Transcript_14545/m.20551 type:complete len:128 (+) Transcript_14545:188-571(+)
MLRLDKFLLLVLSLFASLHDISAQQLCARTTSGVALDDDYLNNALLAVTVPSMLMQQLQVQQPQLQTKPTSTTFGLSNKVLDKLNVAVNTAVSVALAGALFCEFRASSSAVIPPQVKNARTKKAWRI